MKKLETELRNEKNPLDANLERVIPGLHQWHKVNNDAVCKLTHSVNVLSANVNRSLMDVVDLMNQERERSDQKLAMALRSLAQSYDANGSPTQQQFAQYEAVAEALPPIRLSTSETPMDLEGEKNVGGEDEAAHRTPMIPKHPSLLSLWNEWHGLDQFADEYGGVKGKEEQFGSKWRKGIVNPQHFSRTKRVIAAIYVKAESENVRPMEVVASWEEIFTKNSKCSVSNFVKELKNAGYITEREPRYSKKKKKNNNNQ